MNEKKTAKILYRSETNRVIAGICSGFGRYFDFDPVILRIAFVLFTLFGGSGILIYIVCWLIIPTESETGQITEASIKQGANEIKDKAKELTKNAKGISQSENAKFFLGLIILGLGILLLLDNFNIVRFFNLWKLWPLSLVFIGIVFLTQNGRD